MSGNSLELVRADTVVPCEIERARTRLWSALTRSGATDCDGTAVELALEVGPRRGRGPMKTVRAHLITAEIRHDSFVFPLRWEPAGRFASLYPRLDARVALTPLAETACLLTLAGGYQPPLGLLGSVADRVVMSRVAGATADAIVHQLADALMATPAAIT